MVLISALQPDLQHLFCCFIKRKIKKREEKKLKNGKYVNTVCLVLCQKYSFGHHIVCVI